MTQQLWEGSLRPAWDIACSALARGGKGRARGTLRAIARPTHDNLALLPSIEDSIQQRNSLCGTPDDVISLLQEVEEKYSGLRHVIVSSAMGTPKAVYMDQLARFAEEVMPAFRGDRPLSVHRRALCHKA